MSFSSILSKLVLLPLAALLFWGCRSKIEVKVEGSAPAGLTEAGATVPMKILSRMPVIASPGERVTIDGQGFRSVMTLALVDGRTVDLKVESDSKASFVMPSDLSFGEMALTARQEDQTQMLTLVFDAGRIDYPLFSGSAADICEGQQFYNQQGALVSGTKNCDATANASKCQRGGELGCVTHVAFTSAETAKLIADNLKQGVTIAGVTGSFAATSAAVCVADGATGCLASAGYPAAAAADLAAKVLQGQTVAGMTGTVTLPAVGKVLSGVSYGVGGGSLSGALTLPSASNVRSGSGSYGDPGTAVTPLLADCAADGAQGCVTTAAYKSVNMSNFTDADVRSGVMIAGVAGSLVSAPSACGADGDTGCLANASYRAAATSGLADKVLSGQTVAATAGNVTLPAVGKVLASTSYGVGGSISTGTLTLPAAGSVLAGSGSYGDPGSAVTPSYSPDFPAVSNVLSSDTVNGAAGTLTLPALGQVLTATSYGVGGSGSTGTLTLPAAGSVLAGSGSYGDPGSSVTPSYSPDFPAASNVLSSDTVNGAAGTLTLPAVGQVLTGISYGVGGNGSTGSLTLPAAGSVLTGSGSYGDPGSSVTPSYSPDFPDAANVLSSDTVNGAAGSLTLPLAANVRVSNGAFGAGGSSVTPALANCAADGAEDCVTTASYKSVNMSNFTDADVRSGVMIAGVAGSLVSAPSACGADGDTGCIANASYRAAATTGLADKVLSGQTVAATAGNVTLPAVGKVLASTSYGVGGSGSTGTLTLPAAGSVLAGSGSYGDPGSAVTPSYSPDFPAASNVLSSDTVNGAAGTLTLPAVGQVLTGTSYGVGGSGSTGTLTLPAAGSVLAGSGSYGDPGSSVTPSYSPDFPAASNVLSSDTVNGAAGTLTLPALGQVLTGTSYGVGGSGSTGTLTLPAAGSVLAGSGSYGDPGSSVTPSYSPDFPAASNVLSSDTVDGAAGTLTLPLVNSVLISVGAYGVGGNGSTPTLTLPAVGQVLASTQYGVGGNGSTGTLTLPSASNVLTGSGTYGDPGSSVTPGYSPDFPAAANVLSNDTVNGAAGALTLPAAGQVLASTQYGVGGNGSVGTLTLPSASSVLTGSGTYGDPGSAITPSYSPDFPDIANVLSSDTVNGAAGTLTLPTAANVRVSNGAFGVGGNSVTPTLATCGSDGDSGCVAVGPTYAAMVVAGAQDKILSGSSVGAVPGNVTLPVVGKVLSGIQYGAAGTGLTGTLTLPAAGSVLAGSGTYGDPGSAITPSYSPDFPDAANVLSSDTVNGASGTLVLPAVGTVLTATSYGVGGTGSTGTLTLPTAGNVLSGSGAYGDPGSALMPTLTLPTAGNVLSSSGSYGVGGTGTTPTLTLPAVGKVLTGTSYGVGGTGSTGTLTLPSAGNVLSGSGAYGDPGSALTPTLTVPVAGDVYTGIQYGAGGTALTGTLTLASAAHVRTSQGTFGRGGNSVTPSLADCNSDGGTGCVTTSSYKAASNAVLLAGNIKRGVQIGGVTGDFPSTTSPLPRYSDSGATTNEAGSDITDLTNFVTQLTSAGSFEFWDSTGIRRTGSGDADIMASNVKLGTVFENLSLTGTLPGGPSCSSDGEIGCMTTSRYKSMDTDSSVISAWDIRKGKTAGGLSGEIVFYKNMANTSRVNRTSGTGASAGLDIYDTIDDYNGGDFFPTQNPGGWDQATGANWLRDPVSDSNSNGVCDGAEHCVYIDRITGSYWAQPTSTTRNWEDSITYCHGLNGSSFGGYTSGWRLPTQKDLTQAYVNGIWSQKDSTKLNLAEVYTRASSTLSDDMSYRWGTDLYDGGTDRNGNNASLFRSVCVRGP